MGQPAAKSGDRITAKHQHMVQPPSGSAAPAFFSFSGSISGGLSTDVFIMGKPAAVVSSTADNASPHVPEAGVLQPEPIEKAQIRAGSETVLINGKGAARHGDRADACGLPGGTVEATGTVFIG